MSHPRHGDTRRRLPSWWWVLALSGLLVGGLCGLILAGTPLLARIELGRTLTRIAVQSGFEIRVERVRIDLRGRLVLEDIRAADWAGSGITLRAERVRTRVHAGALLRGASGSADVDFEGLLVSVDPATSDQGTRHAGVLRRLARLASDARGPLVEPWRVTAAGARVLAGAPGTRGGWSAHGIRLLVGRPGPGGAVKVELHGKLDLDDGPAAVAVTLGLADDRLSALTIELDRPAALGLLPGLSARVARFTDGAWTFWDVSGEGRFGAFTARGSAAALLVAAPDGRLPPTLGDAERLEVWEPDVELAREVATAPPAAVRTGVVLHSARLRAAALEGSAELASAEVEAAFSGGDLERLSGTGHLRLHESTVSVHPLGPVPLPDAEGPVTLAWSRAEGLVLRGPELRASRATLDARLAVGPKESTLELDIPDQPCRALFAAIPRRLVPRLGTPAASGSVSGRLFVRWTEAGETHVESSGVYDCRLGPLAPDRERRLSSVVEGRPPLPAHLRAVVLGALDPGFDRHPGVRLPEARELRTCKSPWCALSLTERLVGLVDPPPHDTLASRVEVALEALRLEELAAKDQLIAAWAERVPTAEGEAPGLAALVRRAVGRPLEEATALDVVFALMRAEGRTPGEHAAGSPLPESARRALSAAMERLMLQGAITPEEFVAAAPYDPLIPR